MKPIWEDITISVRTDPYTGLKDCIQFMGREYWLEKHLAQTDTGKQLVDALQNLMNGITSGAIKTDYDETMERAVIQAYNALRKAKGETPMHRDKWLDELTEETEKLGLYENRQGE